jgi:hypothetical protein
MAQVAATKRLIYTMSMVFSLYHRQVVHQELSTTTARQLSDQDRADVDTTCFLALTVLASPLPSRFADDSESDECDRVVNLGPRQDNGHGFRRQKPCHC